MEPLDDDRFREPGGRFEREEPIAVAVIEGSTVIDWSDAAHSPTGTLWLPETLFHEIAAASRLRDIDLTAQARLTPAECRALAPQLATLEGAAQDPDVRVAVALVRERAEVVAASKDGHVLLIEGP